MHFFLVFSPRQWLTLHTLVVLLALATYAALSLARRQRRHPSAAIGWVLFLALVPYVALPLFLLLGTRKTVRARRHPRVALEATAREELHEPGGRFRALAAGLGMPEPVPCRELAIHRDGAMALERLRMLLLSARHTLEVSSFLLGRDEVGEGLMALLAQRAREGVRVRLMIDGVGLYLGGRPNLRPLRAAGVQVGLFVRPWSSPLRGRVNLRNHRKVAIADGAWLWTGGRNLASEYFIGRTLLGRHERPWTDLSFDLQGPLAVQAREQFERDWAVAVGEPARKPRRQPLPLAAAGEPLVQLLPTGPDQADDTLHELLVDACFNAQGRILAVTPYFVPDPVLLMAFALAARRGVTVDLLLPRRSNHHLADLARPAAVRELLDSGARVWLVPAMVHAKLVVVDRTVALAGSLNLDARSLFLNYEMMVAFYDRDAIERFTAWAEELRAGAHALRPHRVGALRELGEGLLRWLTFQL
ncbi:MAG TPA: phospholipase D-like domain-containing protein [Ramlibacter sp.]|uniref:phospholipase D-like domain-containing protein n=1 Tax=Ramlibacter sp. TaxID=1917967 RepID=UPI002D7FEE79|nr:phospholipase D-like domain-containing protein [Ramlibacter sp.]HET8748242.1 phospholipase D-like domain-containing protein [Ramlibacter sp.]